MVVQYLLAGVILYVMYVGGNVQEGRRLGDLEAELLALQYDCEQNGGRWNIYNQSCVEDAYMTYQDCLDRDASTPYETWSWTDSDDLDTYPMGGYCARQNLTQEQIRQKCIDSPLTEWIECLNACIPLDEPPENFSEGIDPVTGEPIPFDYYATIRTSCIDGGWTWDEANNTCICQTPEQTQAQDAGFLVAPNGRITDIPDDGYSLQGRIDQCTDRATAGEYVSWDDQNYSCDPYTPDHLNTDIQFGCEAQGYTWNPYWQENGVTVGKCLMVNIDNQVTTCNNTTGKYWAWAINSSSVGAPAGDCITQTFGAN